MEQKIKVKAKYDELLSKIKNSFKNIVLDLESGEKVYVFAESKDVESLLNSEIVYLDDNMLPTSTKVEDGMYKIEGMEITVASGVITEVVEKQDEEVVMVEEEVVEVVENKDKDKEYMEKMENIFNVMLSQINSLENKINALDKKYQNIFNSNQSNTPINNKAIEKESEVQLSPLVKKLLKNRN